MMRRDPDSWAFAGWLAIAAAVVGVLAWQVVATYELAYPRVLFAALVLPGLAWLRIRRERRSDAQVRVSALRGHPQRPFDPLALLRPAAFAASLAGAALLLLAMARPQSSDNKEDITREGIDIILAMDLSGSMLARDLKPDRLEASKAVAAEFIDARPDDRIGLVVYEGEA